MGQELKKMLDRRNVLKLGLGVAIANSLCPSVFAQTYPSRTITVVCPYPAGATTDMISRIFAQALAAEINATVIVENKAGAGGNIGSSAVAKAKPDGYTILLGAMGPMAVNGALYPSLGFDPSNDFAPLGLVASVPLALVVPASSPIKTIEELVSKLRDEGFGTNYASAGIGTPMHLAGELFAKQINARLQHIAYRGSAPAISDLIGGHVPLMFDALVNILPQIQGGTLRALATTSGGARPMLLNGIPTLREAGIDVVVAGWYGFLVPARTPEAVRDKLSSALTAIVTRVDVARKFVELGSDPVDSSPQAFRALIESETAKWQSLIRAVGIKAE